MFPFPFPFCSGRVSGTIKSVSPSVTAPASFLLFPALPSFLFSSPFAPLLILPPPRVLSSRSATTSKVNLPDRASNGRKRRCLWHHNRAHCRRMIDLDNAAEITSEFRIEGCLSTLTSSSTIHSSVFQSSSIINFSPDVV